MFMPPPVENIARQNVKRKVSLRRNVSSSWTRLRSISRAILTLIREDLFSDDEPIKKHPFLFIISSITFERVDISR
jgi:hypothetical protein